MMTIGEAMSVARRVRGISQAVLAARAGVTSQALSRYEGDKIIPSLMSFIDLADSLGVSLDEYSGRSQVKWLPKVGDKVHYKSLSESTRWRVWEVVERPELRNGEVCVKLSHGEGYVPVKKLIPSGLKEKRYIELEKLIAELKKHGNSIEMKTLLLLCRRLANEKVEEVK